MNNIGKVIARHENQLAAFKLMRQEAEEGLLRQEGQLLEKFHCDYHTASYEVWEVIEDLRREHYKNWGNDGKLITELMRRQSAELQKVIDSTR
jgi:hypothetical protein